MLHITNEEELVLMNAEQIVQYAKAFEYGSFGYDHIRHIASIVRIDPKRFTIEEIAVMLLNIRFNF
jgi:hypothetical protein